MENIQLIQTDDGSSSLFNTALQETYHSRHGAVQESVHVFIKNGLHVFSGQHQGPVSVFEVGFGTGLNALLALLWAEENKIHLDYTSVEAFPITWEVAGRLNYPQVLGGRTTQTNFEQLHQAEWGRKVNVTEHFSLFKIKSSVLDSEFGFGQFDVIFFDAFAPAKQPEMWALPVLRKIVNGMKVEGVFVTYCAKGQVKRDLKSLGATVESLPGPPGKREMIRAKKSASPANDNSN